MSKYGSGFEDVAAGRRIAPREVPHDPSRSAFVEMAEVFGYDAFSTAAPALAVAATIAPDGSIVELGGGFSSTPLLRALAVAGSRPFVTVEHDPEWLAVARYFSPHVVEAGPSAESVLEAVAKFDVNPALVFVDGSERGKVLRYLGVGRFVHPAVVVCHDFAEFHDHSMYLEGLDMWEEGALDERIYPHTAIFCRDAAVLGEIAGAISARIYPAYELERIVRSRI